MTRARDAADQINRVNSSAANATAITVDASENVGIGTSSPASGTRLTLDNPGFVQALLSTSDTARISLYGDSAVSAVDAKANPLALYAGGAERMRIDSSGNVGIGTSSPSQPLHVSTATNPAVHITNTDGTNGSTLRMTMATNGAFIGTQNPLGGSDALRFGTGNEQERMRIDSSGNVLFNGTSTAAAQVSHFEAGRGSLLLKNATTGASHTLQFINPNGTVGQIYTNGSSTVYSTSSDYRLKTDAQPMTGASARVQALNPVNFEWLSDGTRVDGFLAHEAQEVVPEAVSGTKDAMRDEEYEVTPAVYEDVVIPAVLDEDGNELESERTEQRLVTEAVMGTRSVPDHQGIDQSKLVPLLTAALQEALTKIDTMETRLSALEGA